MTNMFDKWEHRDIALHNQQKETPMQNDATKAVTPSLEPVASTAVEPMQPVAYDAEGNPLYAAPPVVASAQEQSSQNVQTQYVHMTRAITPEKVEVPDEVKKRHDQSVKDFPQLNLSEHEYVISAVRRHPIGMLGPILVTVLSIALVLSFAMNYPYIAELAGWTLDQYGAVLLISVLLVILFLIGGYLALWVYMNNRFFLTNESVIQEIQNSIFSRKEQTVSLMNIEDASYDQHGPLQTFINYGKIRLSTEGEETTYRFDYVANPKEEIATLNNAVEAFKNGRPVEGPAESNENN